MCFIQIQCSPKPFHFNDVLKKKETFMASVGWMERRTTDRIKEQEDAQVNRFLSN